MKNRNQTLIMLFITSLTIVFTACNSGTETKREVAADSTQSDITTMQHWGLGTPMSQNIGGSIHFGTMSNPEYTCTGVGICEIKSSGNDFPVNLQIFWSRELATKDGQVDSIYGYNIAATFDTLALHNYQAKNPGMADQIPSIEQNKYNYSVTINDTAILGRLMSGLNSFTLKGDTIAHTNLSSGNQKVSIVFIHPR